jgi:catechol 2,3-dioxygenase
MVQTKAPVSIGRVALTVHDLDRVSDFYQQAVGLHRLRMDASSVALGAGETTLLELRRDPGARHRSPREAGLFHTAFLLPTRADLGRWVKSAVQTKPAIVGASDHYVSEAIYLTDPEGNGVEIYADRPRESWTWQNGLVVMGTVALDIDDLMASAGSQAWRGFPTGAVVGHVHLQVGALAPAEAFYADTLGLDVTCRYSGATFYASGGYHHHLATNIWNSRGAGVRAMPSTGLADVEIVTAATGSQTLLDPWGTAFTLTAAV